MIVPPTSGCGQQGTLASKARTLTPPRAIPVPRSEVVRSEERVFLPGYVLIEMDLDNDLWHVIKNTPRVTGFLGTGDNPVALSEAEVSSILFRSEAAKDKPSDSAAKKYFRDAKKGYGELAKAHKGTPWEVLGKREELTALGLEWQAY